jgi:hypothetical protein
LTHCAAHTVQGFCSPGVRIAFAQRPGQPRLAVFGHESATMSGSGLSCPVPTESWMRLSAPAGEVPAGTALIHPCHEHKPSHPALPRHTHTHTHMPPLGWLVYYRALACLSWPGSLSLPLQSNNNTTILTT